MKTSKMNVEKNKAQAMVEFALVLPLLLMLLYGILEAGRLLFIYSSVVTASRQAVRYGSATGEGTGGLPRYQDCDGIRAAAQRVDFLNAINDDDILIGYDSGPNSTITPVCNGSANLFAPTNNSSRLVVTIDGDYTPIVPKIVGFIERSDANNKPIKAQSARTVIVSVSIQVTAPPPAYTPSTSTWTPSPIASPTNTATNTPTSTPTLTPIFSLTPTHTPTITLTPTKTLTPTLTLTPSLTPTKVPICSNLVPGAIILSGNTMTLTIRNPNPYSVRVANVFVVWDHDKGHQTGSDKTLTLLSASLGAQFWTGSSAGPSATLTPNPATAVNIPGANATSTLVFTFHQTYDDRSDGSEEILINFSTPGCELTPIHVKRSQ